MELELWAYLELIGIVGVLLMASEALKRWHAVEVTLTNHLTVSLKLLQLPLRFLSLWLLATPVIIQLTDL